MAGLGQLPAGGGKQMTTAYFPFLCHHYWEIKTKYIMFETATSNGPVPKVVPHAVVEKCAYYFQERTRYEYASDMTAD